MRSDEAQFVEVLFGEGPLGITLRRRPEDGKVFIFDIVPNSQAVDLNVAPNDELWSVGESEIGDIPLDKEAWTGLITLIKQSPRPLKFVWRRKMSNISTEESQQTPQYGELLELVKRISTRDRDTYKRVFMLDPAQILQPDRFIVKQADAYVENSSSSSSSSLFSSRTLSRRIFLMNDLFVVAILLNGNVFAIEYLLTLSVCKLFAPPQMQGSVLSSSISLSSALAGQSFQILFPGGNIKISSDSEHFLTDWVPSIYLQICSCVDDSAKVLGWRHQIMIGTVHSAVIRRDDERIRELISFFESETEYFSLIDQVDEDGYSPLHYACMFRLRTIVKLLHEATADVTVTDRDSLTPLHWSALQLDNVSLSLLCTHVFDLDLLDNYGRSPLAIACIEGRNNFGRNDNALLKMCVDCMLEHKPNLHYSDFSGQTLLHYLAGNWQFETMEGLLNAGCPDVNIVDARYFLSPLHFAVRCTSIKTSRGYGMQIMRGSKPFNDEDLDDKDLVDRYETEDCVETLKCLIRFGAKVNGKDVQGRSAVAILLECSDRIPPKLLTDAVGVLLSHGARVDDSSAILQTLQNDHPDINIFAMTEKWNLLPVLDCERLEIRLLHFEESGSHDDSSKSDKVPSVNCSLCSSSFGLFRRQHRCRFCSAACCDDCSKKRLLIQGSQTRSCDCCYNRALALQKKINRAESTSISNGVLSTSISAVTDRENSDNLNKKSMLFGHFDSSKVNENHSSGKSVLGRPFASETLSVLNETHQQLELRGEKLSQLSDKTADLAFQASDFAKMARQLNDRQKSRWF